MTIRCYVGRMGSGKSLEVVKNFILPCLAEGRRVVSNISGLDQVLIQNYLVDSGINVDEIGKLVQISHEDLLKPSFWRTDKDEEKGYESFVQPGDALALDEIWRVWKKRGELEPRAMNFIRMHRHMPHDESGLTCEIALISQSLNDINLNVRDVVDQTFRMTKLTNIGADKLYKVDIFQGASVKKCDLIQTENHKYDKEIFPLYSSHSQKKSGLFVQEKSVDKRGNIFKTPFFKFMVPLSVLCLIGGVWGTMRFFNTDRYKKKEVNLPVNLNQNSNQFSINQQVQNAQSQRPQSNINTEFKVIGFYYQDGKKVWMLRGTQNQIRYVLEGYEVKQASAKGWQFGVKTETDFFTDYIAITQNQSYTSIPK